MKPGLDVLDATTVTRILAEAPQAVMAAVEAAYVEHAAGRALNPACPFLRPPDRPDVRFGALPAMVGEGLGARIGLKWIASVPANLGRGAARASAVVVLNDPETGAPAALLEGASISAARTAASAALAARVLSPSRRARRLAVVGAGRIAGATLQALTNDGWMFDHVRVFDLNPGRASDFATTLAGPSGAAAAATSAAEALEGADLAVFATTALEPHIPPDALGGDQLVLHLSLRDLEPEAVLDAANYVDDPDHALTAMTTLHRARLKTGSASFVAGKIGDLLTGRLRPQTSGLRIFSPFGLGMLDVAVAWTVHELARDAGLIVRLEGFFSETI
jgi:ornithine cyclodeaminase